jgi:hypothetical protein
MLDPYYTPRHLAAQMVEAIERDQMEAVLDPAAGRGSLLSCAATRWPAARILAGELDESRVMSLRASFLGWTVHRCDFLDVAQAAPLARQAKAFPETSVLLNPPFSSRGGTRWATDIAGTMITGSRAMAFLIRASDAVGPRGQMSAIVPAGLLTSERDAPGRDWLTRHGVLEELERLDKRTFHGAVSATAHVRWTPRSTIHGHDGRGCKEPVLSGPSTSRSFVVRGTRQMHTVERKSGRGTVRLVHTTDLRDGTARPSGLCIKPNHRDRVVAGPAVLLPRVGRPDWRKVALHLRGRVALSDCVFAITCSSGEGATALQQALVDRFALIKACFGGTGAPYMRQDDLVRLLDEVMSRLRPNY